MLQAIKQMYVLVLGLDVLGNPFGVLRGLATGIEDLFYEPYQGAIQGPEEFAEGLALGVRSLLGHAVGKTSLLETTFSVCRYGYGAGDTVEEKSGIFSLVLV